MVCSQFLTYGGILISLLTGLSGGCTLQNSPQSSNPAGQLSPAPNATSSTKTAPQTTQQNQTTQNNQTRTQTLTPASGQAVSCIAPSYFANITWTQGQPSIRFGEQPSQVRLNSPAIVSTSSNDSLTYVNQRGEMNLSVEFRTSGDCTIRSVTADGKVMVDESGRTRLDTQTNTPPNSESYRQGYEQGYDRGYQDGRNARLYRSGYNPDAVFQSSYNSGNTEFDRGYRDGFYRGFEDGYNSVDVTPPDPITPPALW